MIEQVRDVSEREVESLLRQLGQGQDADTLAVFLRMHGCIGSASASHHPLVQWLRRKGVGHDLKIDMLQRKIRWEYNNCSRYVSIPNCVLLFAINCVQGRYPELFWEHA